MIYTAEENMKRKNSFVLDEKDDKAVLLFSELGMPKNLAKTLMYISQVDECRSADVEQGADLRQPEVSVAMQEMRRRGWAKKRDLKKKGKGRPVHIYKLTRPLPQLSETTYLNYKLLSKDTNNPSILFKDFICLLTFFLI